MAANRSIPSDVYNLSQAGWVRYVFFTSLASGTMMDAELSLFHAIRAGGLMQDLMPLICMAVDKSIESLKCYTLTLKNKSMIKRNYVYMDTVEGLTVMHVPITCMAICHL
jgi:hypothetical protein